MSKPTKATKATPSAPPPRPEQQDGVPSMGRRDKRRDPGVVKRFVDAVLAGNPFYNAAALAGISQRSYQLWMEEGRALQDSTPHSNGYKMQFFRAVKEAEAKAIHRNVMVIQQASATSWQAAAWFLERRYWKDWGRKEQIESVGPGGGPIEVKDVTAVPVLTKDRIQRMITRLEAEGGGNGSNHDASTRAQSLRSGS